MSNATAASEQITHDIISTVCTISGLGCRAALLTEWRRAARNTEHCTVDRVVTCSKKHRACDCRPVACQHQLAAWPCTRRTAPRSSPCCLSLSVCLQSMWSWQHHSWDSSPVTVHAKTWRVHGYFDHCMHGCHNIACTGNQSILNMGEHDHKLTVTVTRQIIYMSLNCVQKGTTASDQMSI